MRGPCRIDWLEEVTVPERTRTLVRATAPQRNDDRTGGAAASAPARVPLAGLVHPSPTVRRSAQAVADPLGGTAADDTVVDALRRRRGRGQPLPSDIATRMGQELGRDLSDVRVHTDREADALSRAVQAKAFTTGTDIYFTAGSYAPRSTAGQHLLAHELTHVVQQSGAPRTPVQRTVTIGRADDPAEVEAERVATRVVRALQRSAPTESAEAPLAIEHRHGAGCGHEPIRRFLGVIGITGVAALRQGEVSTDDEGVPQEFIDLADTLQKVGAAPDTDGGFAKAASFGDSTAVGGVTGVVSGISALKGLYSSGKDTFEGIGNARSDNSIVKNLGAQQIEGGVTDLLGSGGGGVEAVTSLIDTFAGSEIPVVGEVNNFYNAGVKGKRAVEDAVASERLRRQKRKIKHVLDHELDDDLRAARLDSFLEHYQAYRAAMTNAEAVRGEPKVVKKIRAQHLAEAKAAKKKMKSGDLERFEAALADYTGPDILLPKASVADKIAFLDHCAQNNIKEFGYGTEFRKEQEKRFKADREGAAEDYVDARSLGKVASFGHRRKAETATVNSVEAAGSALDGIGTFTAGADMGATKATGKVLKTLTAAYTGTKSLVKRARRVHKLRTARNEMGYGDKDDRGIWWGAKQFFFGDIDKRSEKAKAALKDPSPTGPGVKGAAKLAALDPAARAEMVARLTRRLTRQALRRIDDLIRCLGSTNDRIFQRASKILHIVAETNLAGAIARIKDSDLAKFRALAQKMKDTTNPPTEAEKKDFETQRDAIRDIVDRQLQGIGG